MSGNTKVHDALFWKRCFSRTLLLYIAFAISSTFFSNWRFFPSLDLMVFPENWGKMTFYILLLGLPYLLLAQLISLVLVARFQIQTSYLADAIFIALFLIGPVSLISGSFYHAANATFSFAVTEGLVIDDNVVTELGKKYFFMQKMQDVFHMTIYIILRFLGGATLFGGIFKLTSS